jgi:hypothetical protein
MQKRHLILVLLASLFVAAPVFADPTPDGTPAPTAETGK